MLLNMGLLSACNTIVTIMHTRLGILLICNIQTYCISHAVHRLVINSPFVIIGRLGRTARGCVIYQGICRMACLEWRRIATLTRSEK